MSKNIAIIGGGIIGLCSAYYLSKQGHQVTVFDKSNMDSGASYVNAGFLCPSHIIPLAAPGVVKKGIKWMFDSSSPLYVKPRLEPDFLRWSWAFNKSCNASHVNKSIPVIKDIALLGQELYEDLKNSNGFTFHFEKKGLLMLCETKKGLEAEIAMAELAKKEGLSVEILDAEAVKRLESNTTINCLGATYFTCDWHTTPNEFMEDLKAKLTKLEVTICKNEGLYDLEIINKKIKNIITSKNTYAFDEVVMAAGSWSPALTKKLGINLLIQAGKGYSINSKRDHHITIPSILSERKVAVTPMNGFTRFAGTMEIAGINQTINKVRVDAIANAVKSCYLDVDITTDEKDSASCGLRPVSPDGLPYIGRSSKCANLTIATGHAMLGWSLGTATGKLVQEIIDEVKPSLDVHYFHPDRRF